MTDLERLGRHVGEQSRVERAVLSYEQYVRGAERFAAYESSWWIENHPMLVQLRSSAHSVHNPRQ